MEPGFDWVWIYKFGRQAAFAILLAGIAFHLYRPRNREHFEGPAARMLEDGER